MKITNNQWLIGGFSLTVLFLLIGLLIVNTQLQNAKQQLNSVPCWEEVCVTEKIIDENIAFTKLQDLQFRKEKVLISNVYLNESVEITFGRNFPITKFQKKADDTIKEFIISGKAIAYVYIETNWWDGTTLLAKSTKGTKPEWVT